MSNYHHLQVIFGTGPLAMATMRALLKEQLPVRMVNTRGVADVPAGVEVVKGDAYNVDSTTAVTQGATVVYQCAQPPYHQWPEKFPAMQAAILEGTAKNGARLVLAENLYGYGEVNGKIHEGLPYLAHTRKGKTRAAMSETALAAHRAGKLPVTMARGSDFFGPGVLESGLGERAIAPALSGKTAQMVGNIDLPHTFTFIEDFGKALAILGQRQEALGRAWHVPNDRPTISQREIMTLFFTAMGKPPKMTAVSQLMMRLAGLFIPGARETVEMMYEFEKPFVVDSTAFEQTFGLKATPLAESVPQTVAWYRSESARKAHSAQQ